MSRGMLLHLLLVELWEKDSHCTPCGCGPVAILHGMLCIAVYM
jgi:hypothetical protein